LSRHLEEIRPWFQKLTARYLGLIRILRIIALIVFLQCRLPDIGVSSKLVATRCHMQSQSSEAVETAGRAFLTTGILCETRRKRDYKNNNVSDPWHSNNPDVSLVFWKILFTTQIRHYC